MIVALDDAVRDEALLGWRQGMRSPPLFARVVTLRKTGWRSPPDRERATKNRMRHDVHSLQKSHGGVAALNRPGLPARCRDMKELGVSAAASFADGVRERDARALAPRASVKLTGSHVRNLFAGWYVVRRPSVFHHRRSPLSFPN
jgi:hypothetical protein